MTAAPSVTAVVVTYERRELLLRALTAIDSQSHRPDRVVVVDNASRDGTGDAVRAEFPDVELVRLPRNTGGAGGFAVGMASALAEPVDLLWLLDDDTIATPTALAALVDAYRAVPAQSPALVASRVAWTDGTDHPMNTPRRRLGVRPPDRAAAAAVGCIPIRSASFVSVLLDAGRCRAAGLPVADFFLWNDDFEYTTRLLRNATGLWCPASVVVHETARPHGSQDEPGERFYFEVRNKLWTLLRLGSLRPAERALYAAATLHRWFSTVRTTRRRTVILKCLGRGALAALRSGPRPNAVVLAGLPGGSAGDPPTPGYAGTGVSASMGSGPVELPIGERECPTPFNTVSGGYGRMKRRR